MTTRRRAWSGEIEFLPVTPQRLLDLIRFSEQHGKFRWCSCMRWRATSTEFNRLGKAGREQSLHEAVRSGTPVGILGYVEGEPVAWCSIAPRATYAALERARALPRLDDARAWSVVCFFLDRRFRGRGLTLELLEAAVGYARSQGAEVIEGYPKPEGVASYAYMGSPATFLMAGFRDVSPRGASRPIMRRSLAKTRRLRA